MKLFDITVNGRVYEVAVEERAVVGGNAASTPPKVASTADPQATSATVVAPVQAVAPKGGGGLVPAGAQTIPAPMPGKILSINVKPGDGVRSGDVLLILEAMKMQNEIMAPADGKVVDVRVAVGQTVSTGEAMVVMN